MAKDAIRFVVAIVAAYVALVSACDTKTLCPEVQVVKHKAPMVPDPEDGGR